MGSQVQSDKSSLLGSRERPNIGFQFGLKKKNSGHKYFYNFSEHLLIMGLGGKRPEIMGWKDEG